MRIRYLKNTEEILTESALVIGEPRALRGSWRGEMEKRMAASAAKVWLEIGCGMGGFLRRMAEEHPADAFIGVERISTVLARAAGTPEVENIRTANVPYSVNNEDAERYRNMVFVREEAEYLGEIFADGEVDGIFLNFSDPWPKIRHAKRRLTSAHHLAVYAKILRPGGVLRFKTDNDDLFAFSLESLRENGWEILRQTDDLHAVGEPMAEGNVVTEYEANFMRRGKNIHAVEARFAGEGIK